MIFLMLKTTVKMKVIICIHMNLGARKYAFRRAPSEDSDQLVHLHSQICHCHVLFEWPRIIVVFVWTAKTNQIMLMLRDHTVFSMRKHARHMHS